MTASLLALASSLRAQTPGPAGASQTGRPALETRAPGRAGVTAADTARTEGMCTHARPGPRCGFFVLTNAGAYVLSKRPAHGGFNARMVADWGVMMNVGSRDAIGVSVLATGDGDVVAAGPAFRYRRWMNPHSSFDVALGAAPWSLDTPPLRAFGLIKYSPVQWVGVALRPELVGGQSGPGQGRARLSFGVELGEEPGAGATVLAAAALAAVALAGYVAWKNGPPLFGP